MTSIRESIAGVSGRVDRGRVAALVLVALVSAPIASGLVRFAGLERSTWVQVSVAADRPAPPSLSVAYAPDERLPILWDNDVKYTILGLGSERPAKLLAIETDRGVVAPWMAQTWAPLWERVANPNGLLVKGPGIVEIAGPVRRLTLTFERGQGSVEIGWLDQRATVDLSPASGDAATVTLAVPDVHRGWVLLPPRSISGVSIRAAADSGRFALRSVDIRGRSRQTWLPSAAYASNGYPAASCRTTWQDGALIVDSGGAACDLALSGVRPLNQARLAWLGVWLLTILGGLGVLAAVTTVARRLQRFAADRELVESRFGRWLRERTSAWTLARVIAGVGAFTFLYHATYLISVPVHYSFDSVPYYAFGRNFLHTLDLGAIATCRTPGYPLAIAASIRVAGESLQALAIVQHAGLIVVGLGVARFLYPRAGPLPAAIGGALTGTSPLMSVAANAVWTEALFAEVVLAALLVFLSLGAYRPAGLFVAGALAGIAALIGPSGAILMPLMAGWLCLRWWRDPASRVPARALAGQLGALAAASILVVSFWAVHVHGATGRWQLLDSNCGQEGQSSPRLPKSLSPATSVQVAGLFNALTGNDDIDRLEALEPYRVFARFFPVRHRYYFTRFIPWNLYYDDRLAGEVVREYLREFGARSLGHATDALLFNLTHVTRRDASVPMDRTIEDVLTLERTRPYPIAPVRDARVDTLLQSPTVSWTDADALLTALATAHSPLSRGLRAWHLDIVQLALLGWGWLTAASVIAAVLCVLLPGHARYLLLAATAAVAILAPSVLGMGVDRYASLGEGALYLLVTVIGSAVLQKKVRWRREAAAHPEASEGQEDPARHPAEA